MTLTQDDLDTLRAATGGDNSGDGAPNGHNITGAVNALERIAEEMDEWGVTDPANLPGEKATAYDAAHEDFQYWVSELSNLLALDVVGADESIELPNGETIDLSRSAVAAGASNADLPERPDHAGGG